MLRKRNRIDAVIAAAERRSVITLAIAGTMGLVMAAAAGPLGILSIAIMLAWIALQIHRYRRFRQWFVLRLGRPPNFGEPWGSLAHFQYRRRRRSRERMYALLRRFNDVQEFVAAMPDAAVVLDSNQCIVWTSMLAEPYLGLKRRDRGTHITALLRHPSVAGLMRDRPDTPLEIPSPLDERRLLELRLSPLGEEQSILLARDITQLKQLMTMRQDFVANVSHELRTPLTVISGYIEQLTEDDVEAATVQRVLPRLQGPVARMRGLVDDLLQLSRLESGTSLTPKDLDVVDVPSLMQTLIRDLQTTAAKDHRFEVQLDGHLKLRGIERELHSCFQNLLTNAVRYSPNGGTITVNWSLSGEQPALSVKDQGVGISPEHLPRITERFFRVDPARSRETGGTGLGLAIVKHVLRRHRAELLIESVLGAGSTFTARFAREFAVTDDRSALSMPKLVAS